MPYDNPYNRKIAREVEGFNKSYIKNIGDYYPLEGGSLDTGYDTERIVGGAMEEYVRNVLSGSLNVPTQAMPSSSMSGMGMSAGMRKYNKGMRMSAAGFTGGYKKGTQLTQEQKERLKATREFNKTFGLTGPKKVVKNPRTSAVRDLEKLAMREAREDKAFMKEAKKQERMMKREQRGYVPKARKTNPWIDFVKMFASENNISYRDAIRHPNIKSEYRRLMDKPSAIQERLSEYENIGKMKKIKGFEGFGMSGGWAYKGQKLGLARKLGMKKKEYLHGYYKNKGKGIPRQLQDWHNHLENVKQENPDLPLKSALVLAKDTYERIQYEPKPARKRIRRREEALEFM